MLQEVIATDDEADESHPRREIESRNEEPAVMPLVPLLESEEDGDERREGESGDYAERSHSNRL